MMISCEEAAKICSKTQYKEATFLERLKLNFHLILCKACTKFSKNNKHLTSLCDKANLHSLSDEEKVEMKEKISPKL